MALFRAEIFCTKIRILARICTIVDKIDMRICRRADVQITLILSLHFHRFQLRKTVHIF